MYRISYPDYLAALKLYKEEKITILEVSKRMQIPYATIWSYINFGHPRDRQAAKDESIYLAIRKKYFEGGISYKEQAEELGITHRNLITKVRHFKRRNPEIWKEIYDRLHPPKHTYKMCKGCIFCKPQQNRGHYYCDYHRRRTTLKRLACCNKRES